MRIACSGQLGQSTHVIDIVDRFLNRTIICLCKRLDQIIGNQNNSKTVGHTIACLLLKHIATFNTIKQRRDTHDKRLIENRPNRMARCFPADNAMSGKRFSNGLLLSRLLSREHFPDSNRRQKSE